MDLVVIFPWVNESIKFSAGLAAGTKSYGGTLYKWSLFCDFALWLWRKEKKAYGSKRTMTRRWNQWRQKNLLFSLFKGYSILFSFRPVNGNRTQAQFWKFSQTLLHNHTNGGYLLFQVFVFPLLSFYCTYAQQRKLFPSLSLKWASLSFFIQFLGPPISRSNHCIKWIQTFNNFTNAINGKPLSDYIVTGDLNSISCPNVGAHRVGA